MSRCHVSEVGQTFLVLFHDLKDWVVQGRAPPVSHNCGVKVACSHRKGVFEKYSFFLFPGLHGLCFCLQNFTCPVFGHRARCEAVGHLFQMNWLIGVVAFTDNRNHSAGMKESYVSSGWLESQFQFLSFFFFFNFFKATPVRCEY